jgi:solute carrier family 35 protein E1
MTMFSSLIPAITTTIYAHYYKISYPILTYLSIFPFTVGVMLITIGKGYDLYLFGSVCAIGSAIMYSVQVVLSKGLLEAHASSTLPVIADKQEFESMENLEITLEESKNEVVSLDIINIIYFTSLLGVIQLFPLWIVVDGIHFFLNSLYLPPYHTMSSIGLSGITAFAETILAFNLLLKIPPVTFS